MRNLTLTIAAVLSTLIVSEEVISHDTSSGGVVSAKLKYEKVERTTIPKSLTNLLYKNI